MFEGMTRKQLHARRAVLIGEHQRTVEDIQQYRAIQFDGYRIDPDMLTALMTRRDEIAGEIGEVEAAIHADRKRRREVLHATRE